MMKLGLIVGICTVAFTSFSQGSNGQKKFIPYIASIHQYDFLDRFQTTETIYVDSLNLDPDVVFQNQHDESYRIGIEVGFEYLLGSRFSLGYYLQESHGWFLAGWDERIPFYLSTGIDLNFYPSPKWEITPRIGYSSSFSGDVKGGISYGGNVGYQINKLSHPTPILFRIGFTYLQRSEHEEGVPSYNGAAETIQIRRTDRLARRYLCELALVLKFSGN